MNCIGDNFFNENVALYFFSAAFQGNMALLALVGVFSVYKIQQLSSRLQNIEETIILFARDTFKLMNPKQFKTLDYSDAVILQSQIEQLKVDFSNDTYLNGEINKVLDSAYFKQGIPRIQRLKRDMTSTVNNMKPVFYLTIAVIIVSLIGLPLSIWIHSFGTLGESLVYISFIVLNGIVLNSNRTFVLATLE